MSLPDPHVLAAFGPLGTAELVIIAFLFLIFGGVTAAVIAMAIYFGKRTPPRPTAPPPPPLQPQEPAPPPGPSALASEEER